MDIGSLTAATQLSGAQRSQQAGMAGLKSAALQAQSLVAMLTKATEPVQQTQKAAAPTNGGGAASEQSSERRVQRGSIVNILA